MYSTSAKHSASCSFAGMMHFLGLTSNCGTSPGPLFPRVFSVGLYTLPDGNKRKSEHCVMISRIGRRDESSQLHDLDPLARHAS